MPHMKAMYVPFHMRTYGRLQSYQCHKRLSVIGLAETTRENWEQRDPSYKEHLCGCKDSASYNNNWRPCISVLKVNFSVCFLLLRQQQLEDINTWIPCCTSLWQQTKLWGLSLGRIYPCSTGQWGGGESWCCASARICPPWWRWEILTELKWGAMNDTLMVCNSRNLHQVSRNTYAHLLAFPREDILWCPVFKAATSSWYRNLLRLSHLPKKAQGELIKTQLMHGGNRVLVEPLLKTFKSASAFQACAVNYHCTFECPKSHVYVIGPALDSDTFIMSQGYQYNQGYVFRKFQFNHAKTL